MYKSMWSMTNLICMNLTYFGWIYTVHKLLIAFITTKDGIWVFLFTSFIFDLVILEFYMTKIYAEFAPHHSQMTLDCCGVEFLDAIFSWCTCLSLLYVWWMNSLWIINYSRLIYQHLRIFISVWIDSICDSSGLSLLSGIMIRLCLQTSSIDS